jgi:hypothetical protein
MVVDEEGPGLAFGSGTAIERCNSCAADAFAGTGRGAANGVSAPGLPLTGGLTGSAVLEGRAGRGELGLVASGRPFATGVDVPFAGRTRLTTSGRGTLHTHSAKAEICNGNTYAGSEVLDVGDGLESAAPPLIGGFALAEPATALTRRSTAGRTGSLAGGAEVMAC